MKPLIILTAAWLSLGLGSYSSVQAQPKAPAPTKAPAPGGNGTAPAAAPRYQVGKLSTDPAQYIIDVQGMMASTNNAAARGVGSSLKELWGSNRLTASQQARIVALSQIMLAKRFRPRPHFETFFKSVLGGANSAKLTDQQMDQYLDVLGQTLEKESPQETEKFIFSTSRFLNGGYLHRSGYNTLRAIGGTVSFAYSPIAAPTSNLEFGAPAPKEEPLPAAKPAAKKPVAAKTPAKTAKPAPKKKASSGWDTADLWSSPSGGGWGDTDDGWGTPVKKAPAKKPAAKGAPMAAKATAPAKEAAPAVNAADFETPTASFTPSALPYDEYLAPPARGAVIVVKDVDLFMGTAGDSVLLKKVSGTAVPNSDRFLASGGQLVWSINTNPVTADIAGFDFDMSKPEFTAQPVTLTYPAVLEGSVKGALSYKSVRRKPGAADTGYPRFISLTNDARIKTLGENIQYRGGLSMAGGRLLSAALDGSLSKLTVSLDGKPKFKALSRAYVLGDTLITASRAAITIYEGSQDSVTHPGTQLKYSKPKQELKLAREEGLYKTTPYSDSYHQIDIRTESLIWNLRSPTISFAVLSSKNQQTADFESKEFFTNNRYQQLKSINRLHPLQMLVGYSQSHDKIKTFNVSDLARDLKTSVPNMRTDMAGLARDGYVQWDSQTGQVTILPKGAHYVASARDKKDYDHLAIKSLSGTNRNAVLNLNTNELLVRGVKRFNFTNDSATVFVRPDSAIIRIGKNRNITFNGAVLASAMRFRGANFKFDYDGFYIDMAKIDSIVIRSEARDAKGKPNGKRAEYALTNKGSFSTGRLFLNDPKNKSGRKKKGEYPAFESKSGANVYFGNQGVLGGVYDSTVVFDIPPFRIDSLNYMSQSASGLTGTFRSGGIIPDIATKLTVQEDGAMGFVYNVPKEGFPLYKGRGRVYNKVMMNSKGLQADGTITYQSGTFVSDDFVFYRDSVVTVGKSGTVAAKTAGGVDIPNMTMPPGYMMRWHVRRDSMYLITPRSGEAISLYSSINSKTKAGTAYNFKGTALLTPRNAGGNGRLDGPQSFIKSPEFVFKSDSYSGKRATINVKSAETNKPALTANEVTFDYSLKKGYADFKREEGSTASIDLPYSKFKTTLSGGHWDFKKKQVQLRVAANADSTKSFFYSTNPEQGGLKFKASTGVYDLAQYQMQVGGVPHIATADAWVIPDSGKVSILANGRIQRLKNARVELDSLKKIHKLVKGNIEVLSRMAFAGDAEYTYKMGRDSVALRFSNFEPDPIGPLASISASSGKGSKGFLRRKGNAKEEAVETVAPVKGPPTVATAKITGKFQLTPRIGYRGDLQLNSQRRGFAFVGGEVQLQFGKAHKGGDWVPVKDSIDVKNFTLDLTDAKSADGTPLVTGLFMSDQTQKIYPVYAAAPPSADVPVFKVDGKLRYNDKTGVYSISRTDPSNLNAYEGAALTYTDSTNALTFRGPMTFINSSKDYKMVGSGVGTAKPDSAIYAVDALLAMDITMPPKAIEVMGAELARATKRSPEAQDGSPNERYKLGQFIGDQGVEDYIAHKGKADPLMKLSPKLMHTLVLSKVNLRWNDKKRAWYSVGPIGLAGVGKQPLNALVNGYVEIRREEGADLVEMYLEAGTQAWYYLKYAKNLLLAKSQGETFDTEISSKAKYDYNTATSYGVFLGELADVDAFRSHFEKDYLHKSGKVAALSTAPEPSEELDEVDGKKKKGKGDAATGGGDSTNPAPSPPKKKKKAKANDPFGDGTLDDPLPAPVKKEQAKEKAAPPAAPGADAAPTEPKKAKAKETAPATGDTPNPAQDKKEAERQAKEAEKLKKEEEKKKKDEEKKKKKASDDPFGDS
ncbi:hypothetical protein IC235_12675 [Hymenobacter sp. BT664]|uniref:Uncharacterized protein n=1 Tax=Hymenobacter montanus TaxID=2771359 RepID=A0A927BDC7_9BACT|nr:hypothetical protein [Hymenobacter montanus]MBD2768741.1 hypothetical protein [Hymenobacter montanus]